MADPKSFYKSADIDNNNKVIVFNRIYDTYRFIEEIEPTLTGNAENVMRSQVLTMPSQTRGRERQNFYGTMDVAEITSPINQFLFTNDLNNFINITRSQTISVDVRDISQKRKLVFTERDIGIFSFDLASLGLVRVFEYYSPLLKAIVEPNLVYSIKYPDGKLVYFYRGKLGIPRHEVTWSLKDGAYFSNLLNSKVKGDLVDVEDDKFFHKEVMSVSEHEVEQRQKINAKGQKVFTSTWKKSFIYIPKIEKSIPRIDLIINAAYTGDKNASTELIYGSMGAIAVAEKLQQSGVKFRIFSSYAKRLDNGKRLFQFVKLKDENEPLNANGLAILTSDARFYRYLGFKTTICSAFELGWGNNVPGGVSYPLNDTTEIKQRFIQYLRKTKDFDSGDTIVEDAKIVLPATLSEAEARNLYNQTIADIQTI